ncbi:hypothetical protein SteCoe_34037 [Stentor coeruleus]|uniref:RING-type domain-containing protein n=1 Tax=Stentor coeruleus TaxID=5963 RepID=A0A1R2AVE4_9CILI|nr:hypothetical protein SteCoe_34037 [Stentor coeruleus]
MFISVIIQIALAYQTINLEKLNFTTPSQVIRIISNEPNAFLIGKFGQFPVFEYVSKQRSWMSNCEICDVENWASGKSDMLIKPLNSVNETLFVSMFTTKDIDINKEDLRLKLEYHTIPYCPNKCSGNGVCRVSGCLCYKWFTGYDCSIKIEEYELDSWKHDIISAYSWKFYITVLKENINYIHIEFDESKVPINLQVYLNPSNSYNSMPSMVHYREKIIFPSNNEILTRYYIKEKYLLWSLFCSQNIPCTYSVNLQFQQHNKKALILISIISSLSVLFCIFSSIGIIFLIRKCNSKYHIIESTDRIISINDMNIFFPKRKRITKIQENDQCCICLQEIGNIDIRMLGCFHVFHANCIDIWTKTSYACPVCKRPMIFSRAFHLILK